MHRKELPHAASFRELMETDFEPEDFCWKVEGDAIELDLDVARKFTKHKVYRYRCEIQEGWDNTFDLLDWVVHLNETKDWFEGRIAHDFIYLIGVHWRKTL